jgi:hypothetical protein
MCKLLGPQKPTILLLSFTMPKFKQEKLEKGSHRILFNVCL